MEYQQSRFISDDYEDSLRQQVLMTSADTKTPRTKKEEDKVKEAEVNESEQQPVSSGSLFGLSSIWLYHNYQSLQRCKMKRLREGYFFRR